MEIVGEYSDEGYSGKNIKGRQEFMRMLNDIEDGKDKLEMDGVEMDQMIVEKQGMSISEIFDEYGEAYFRNLESNTLIELQKRKQTIVS